MRQLEYRLRASQAEYVRTSLHFNVIDKTLESLLRDIGAIPDRFTDDPKARAKAAIVLGQIVREARDRAAKSRSAIGLVRNGDRVDVLDAEATRRRPGARKTDTPSRHAPAASSKSAAMLESYCSISNGFANSVLENLIASCGQTSM